MAVAQARGSKADANGARCIWLWIRHIRAVAFTPSRADDSPILADPLRQIPGDEQIGTVTADGAYDTRRCHTAILARDAIPIIPIRKNGLPWKEECPAAKVRNETLRATRHCGRAFWKRWTGYHARSRIEAKMRCLKAFGERITAREPDRKTAEIHIRIALISRFNTLGTAEIVRVAWRQWGKGKSPLRRVLRNNAEQIKGRSHPSPIEPTCESVYSPRKRQEEWLGCGTDRAATPMRKRRPRTVER